MEGRRVKSLTSQLTWECAGRQRRAVITIIGRTLGFGRYLGSPGARRSAVTLPQRSRFICSVSERVECGVWFGCDRMER